MAEGAAVERVKTGIEGLDRMLEGGIPKNNCVLVCGGPGTGKTSVCLEFLYRGAKLYGEKGAFISLEESPETIVKNFMASFPKLGDITELIDSKMISLMKVKKFDLQSFADIVQSYVNDLGVSRVAIDSSTVLKLYFKTPTEFRTNMFDVIEFLKKTNCTALFTAEMPVSSRKGMKADVEQFFSDGVIILYNFEKGLKRVNAIEILKMRGTSHSKHLVPLAITSEGVKVFPEEKVY